MPFALARDPYPIAAHRFGFALAWVVAEPSFQRRILELPSRLAAAQARILRTTVLLFARQVAARAMLAAEERVSQELFEEVGVRLFDAPLPAAMRNAWPEPRLTDAARLDALLGATTFVRDLVERFDEDWFRNPRAGAHMTGLACGPAFDDLPIPDDASKAMARTFEEALG
jgi:hypothetical protein